MIRNKEGTEARRTGHALGQASVGSEASGQAGSIRAGSIPDAELLPGRNTDIIFVA